MKNPFSLTAAHVMAYAFKHGHVDALSLIPEHIRALDELVNSGRLYPVGNMCYKLTTKGWIDFYDLLMLQVDKDMEANP